MNILWVFILFLLQIYTVIVTDEIIQYLLFDSKLYRNGSALTTPIQHCVDGAKLKRS